MITSRKGAKLNTMVFATSRLYVRHSFPPVEKPIALPTKQSPAGAVERSRILFISHAEDNREKKKTDALVCKEYRRPCDSKRPAVHFDEART